MNRPRQAFESVSRPMNHCTTRKLHVEGQTFGFLRKVRCFEVGGWSDPELVRRLARKR
jgi:hypothetical protein